MSVRRAGADDAGTVAVLLDDCNREFDTPTPGPQVLRERLSRLLAGDRLVALLTGVPAVGLAVVSLRENAWYDGPVGLLDELYVAPPHRDGGLGAGLLRAAEQLVLDAGGELLEVNVDGEDVDARRFYERHGYACTEPGLSEPSLYYFRELPPTQDKGS